MPDATILPTRQATMPIAYPISSWFTLLLLSILLAGASGMAQDAMKDATQNLAKKTPDTDTVNTEQPDEDIVIDAGIQSQPVNPLLLGVSQGGNALSYLKPDVVKGLDGLPVQLVRVEMVTGCMKYKLYDPQTKTWNWTVLDQELETIRQHGAQIIINLFGTPAWLASDPKAKVPAFTPPSDDAAFAEYCAAIVRHVNLDRKFGVKYWEFWNEPSGNFFWTAWKPDKTRFYRLYDIVARAVKAADPSAMIGGFGDNVFYLEHYRDWFAYNRNQSHTVPVDFLTAHWYGDWDTDGKRLPNRYAQWANNLSQLAQQEFGKDIPIFFSEWNLAAESSGTHPAHRSAAFIGASLCVMNDATAITGAALFRIEHYKDPYSSLLGKQYQHRSPWRVLQMYSLLSGNRVELSGAREDLYGLASADASNLTVMICRYCPQPSDDNTVRLKLTGLPALTNCIIHLSLENAQSAIKDGNVNFTEMTKTTDNTGTLRFNTEMDPYSVLFIKIGGTDNTENTKHADATDAVEKSVSVCYVPWWVNWRLPDPTIGGLPLEMIDSDSAHMEGYKDRAYAQTIRNFERAGIDTVCWDTFGKPQIDMAGDFLKTCVKVNTSLRMVPLFDVHEATKPDIKKVVGRFESFMKQYHALPGFDRFHAKPYYWTWGTRNMKPEAWRAVFDEMSASNQERKWVGHFNNNDMLKEYAPLFAGMYSWQPQPLAAIAGFEQSWHKTVSQAPVPTIRISPIYLMFRRYGYGFNYTDPRGFQVFHETWRQAIRNHAQWVHITTWNDYDEYTMFEPTVSRGYCLADLNGFYTRQWKAMPKNVEPETNRIFVACPRGVNLGEEGYIDISGIFRSDRLPAKVKVQMINPQNTLFELGTFQVNSPGVQTKLLPFTVIKAHGQALRPVLEIEWNDGTMQTVGSDLPWIDLYGLGHIRERNLWMAEIGGQVPDASVTLTACNDANNYENDYLRKPVRLQINLTGQTEYDYLVLKRNEQQAVVIRDGSAYIPSRHFGGNYGWAKYDTVQTQKNEDGSFVLNVTEPPSTYGMTVDSGVSKLARPKRDATLTGYSQDWYTVIAVDS